MSEENHTPTNPPDWSGLAAKPAFQALLKRKAAFIIASTIFFMIYYFALLVLVGWFPDLMKKEVIGKINLAYIFALSQFFMAWGLAYLYVRKAAEWDRITKDIISK